MKLSEVMEVLTCARGRDLGEGGRGGREREGGREGGEGGGNVERLYGTDSVTLLPQQNDVLRVKSSNGQILEERKSIKQNR